MKVTPDIAVPLATFTGYNLRKQGYVEGQQNGLNSSQLAFATTPASRKSGDPRKSVQELYGSRAAYVDAVNRAKPSGAKGQYLRTLTISTTMGPGVRVDLGTVEARIVVASIDTYLKYSEAVGITSPISRPREVGAGDENVRLQRESIDRLQRENTDLRRQLAERNV